MSKYQTEIERFRNETRFARELHTAELARPDRDMPTLRFLFKLHEDLFLEGQRMFEKYWKGKNRK